MRIGLTGLIASACVATLANTNMPVTVLVNSQGLAQQDLSIRGSGYFGAGISINGLNLKVPYSAHFNAELPIAGHLLSAPETRVGLGNASGHLVGTTAYNTVPQEQNVQTSAGIGSEEHYSGGASVFSSGVGGFVDWEKARRIDHGANDYDRYSGGAHLQHFVNGWQLDLIGAGQKKEFGAQGYYGIPRTVYAKEKTEDTLVFFGATHGELDDAYIRASAAWRQFDDKYRIRAAGFESDVRSRFGALAVEGRTMEIQHIALNLHSDIEYEEVDKDLGTHDRTRGSVLVLPEARFERFTVTAGLNSVFQKSESAEWLPQAGLDWFATDNATVYATYSENVQQPDFQTLHYSGPFRTGNPLLNLKKSKNTELGFRQFLSDSIDWRAAAFYRRVEHVADWTKDAATDIAWTATDLGDMDVFGFETEINFYPSDELELAAFYQWNNKDDYDYYAGLYELDYPEHMLRFAADWKFAPDFTLLTTQILRWQADNNYRSSSDFGADASVGLHWFPRFAHNARLSFLVENMWGSNFQAIPGLKSRPASFSTGITVAW
jgi:vitamin B12 transporter